MTPKNPDAQRLGRLGGLARAKSTSAKQRQAIARAGGLAAAQKRAEKKVLAT